jgi:LL-diaminopimelate aminotransferase
LQEAVRFCQDHGILLVYDNAYSEIAFDGYRPPSIFEFDGAREVAVEFHSFSKTYNMTGWRLGWAAGPEPVISALARIKAFVDTGQFMAVQAAGKAALESYDEWVPGNVEAFRQRRDCMVNAMRNAGFTVDSPAAAMYLWIAMPGGQPSAPFARRALLEEGVVIMPGTALGAGGEGFFRIALTQPAARLEEAAKRLANLL